MYTRLMISKSKTIKDSSETFRFVKAPSHVIFCLFVYIDLWHSFSYTNCLRFRPSVGGCLIRVRNCRQRGDGRIARYAHERYSRPPGGSREREQFLGGPEAAGGRGYSAVLTTTCSLIESIPTRCLLPETHTQPYSSTIPKPLPSPGHT